MAGLVETVTGGLDHLAGSTDEWVGRQTDDADTVTVGEWLATGGLGDDVHTGTPPPIGPGGSALASLGLRTRILGALGFEAARSETGQDVLEGAVDAPTGGDSESGAEGAGAWIVRNLDLIAGFLALLGVVVAIGQLFTINVGDSTS